MLIFDIMQTLMLLMAFYLGVNRLPGVGWFIIGMLFIALFDLVASDMGKEKNNEK